MSYSKSRHGLLPKFSLAQFELILVVILLNLSVSLLDLTTSGEICVIIKVNLFKRMEYG